MRSVKRLAILTTCERAHGPIRGKGPACAAPDARPCLSPAKPCRASQALPEELTPEETALLLARAFAGAYDATIACYKLKCELPGPLDLPC